MAATEAARAAKWTDVLRAGITPKAAVILDKILEETGAELVDVASITRSRFGERRIPRAEVTLLTKGGIVAWNELRNAVDARAWRWKPAYISDRVSYSCILTLPLRAPWVKAKRAGALLALVRAPAAPMSFADAVNGSQKGLAR